MKLGQFIKKLEQLIKKHGNQRVYFGFGETYPTDVNSWRGDYSQLALGWNCNYCQSANSEKLLRICKTAGISTFQGYKGGEYNMNYDVGLYADNWGISSQTIITNIIFDDFKFVIITKHKRDDS